MSFRYVWDKCQEAARSLALTDEPLAARLTIAYEPLSRLQSEADFGSTQARTHFERMLEQVGGAVDAQGCAAAVAEFDDVKLRETAEVLLELYSEVEREHGRRG